MTKLTMLIVLCLASIIESFGTETTNKEHPIPLLTLGEYNTLDINELLLVGPNTLSSTPRFIKDDYQVDQDSILKINNVSELETALSRIPINRIRRVQDLRDNYFDFPFIFGFYRNGSDYKLKIGASTIAVASIDSPNNLTCILLYSFFSKIDIYLNGKLIHVDNEPTNRDPYAKAVSLDLNKGVNIIAFRIECRDSHWMLSSAIAPNSKAAGISLQRLSKEYEPQLVERLIYKEGELIKLNITPNIPDIQYNVRIYRKDNTLVLNTKGKNREAIATIDAAWDEGIYFFEVEFAGIKRREIFAIKKATSPVAFTFPSRENTTSTISLSRAILQDKITAFQDRGNLSRRAMKRAILYYNAYQNLSEKDTLNEYLNEGLYLLSFKSKIDQSNQTFQVFIPQNTREEQLPLLILYPTVISTNVPFIDSPFIEQQLPIMELCDIAQKTKSCILWVGYHNRPASHPIEATHLKEVMDTLSPLINVDKNRISLASACGGAWLMAPALNAHRDQFASISILNPVFDKYTPPEVLFDSFVYSIGEEIDKSTTEYSIYYDGSTIGHGAPEDFLWFLNAHNREKKRIQYYEIPDVGSYHKGAFTRILSTGANRRAPKPFSLETPPSTNGVLFQGIIANSFHIITKISRKDHKDKGDILGCMERSWEKQCFNSLPYAQSDEPSVLCPSTNAILDIGEKDNLAADRYRNLLPTEEKPDKVIIEGRIYTGHVGVLKVIENPDDPTARLLLIWGNIGKVKHVDFVDLMKTSSLNLLVWNDDTGIVLRAELLQPLPEISQ